MLVLSRKQGESIQIGSDVTIHIKHIWGNRISIGVEAPAGVVIRRGELLNEPMEDQQQQGDRQHDN